MKRQLRRVCQLVMLVLAAAALAVPSGARAAASVASSDISFGTVDVTVISGDTAPHTIDVSYFSGSYLITDTAGVIAATGCATLTSTAATCADHPNIDGVTVLGRGGNDTITISSLSPTAGTSPRFRTATGLFSGAGDDTINGSGLEDLIFAGDGNDMIDGGLGSDSIEGEEGVDTVTYASRPASQPVIVDMFGGRLTTGEDGMDVENVIGTPGDDRINGWPQEFGEVRHASSAANVFRGGAGNDVLIGLSGGDKLLGEAGNDRLSGGDQKDVLNGGAAHDRCAGGKSKDKAKDCERKKSIP